MKFLHWKEAEKRANEIKAEMDALNTEISVGETEARSEEITVEKREEVITGLRAKVEKRDGLQTEYNDAAQARDDLKAAEERQIGLLTNLTTSRVVERTKDMDENILESRSYELAWAKYVKTGDGSEARALLNTQGQAEGGILVPKTLANKIEDTLMTGGRLINLCDTISIKGITEYPVVGKKSDPELHDETGESKKEKDIELLSVMMNPQFVSEILRTTRKFEEDSISAFWDWLMAELPDALRRVIDRKILIGGQAAKEGIHGILTNTNAQFVSTLAGHKLNFNTANQAVAKLDDGVEDNVTLVMHRETFYNDVMGLTGTDGHPIWKQVSDNITGRPAFTVGGYPVVFSKELPAYSSADAGKAYMVAGNFKAMKLNFPKGMIVRLIRDDITEMQDNIVRYLSEIYVAGNITRLGSFVKVTK